MQDKEYHSTSRFEQSYSERGVTGNFDLASLVKEYRESFHKEIYINPGPDLDI